MLDPRLPDLLKDGVIQGELLAKHLRGVLADQVAALAATGVQLTLAVVRVGDDPASQIYVRHKINDCAKVGIRSLPVELPATTSEDELVARVAALNADPTVDGVLVQLPVPRHINPDRVIQSLDPRKDVDGFHPLNLGLMIARRSLLEPCTPAGVMTILRALGVDLRGRNAVVVGRSVIVGRPMAQMLMREDATVTVCHRHTNDLEARVRGAEVLVVATGVPGLIRGEWIRPGSVVIDVGINRTETGLCGDVEFKVARTRAAAITPVPGGVGPMTRAMLLWNTWMAAQLRREGGLYMHAVPNLPF